MVHERGGGREKATQSKTRTEPDCATSSHDGHLLNDWRHRSPLVARFRGKQSGVKFLFVTVHLARGNAKLRTEQARGLREWAWDQQLPVVAIGDFNMDYDFATGQGNEAFAELQEGEVWEWVRPAELIDTNWSDDNGTDRYPDSMLDFDFAFVAGAASAWDCECHVIVRPGDFPDDERTADYRPVELTVGFDTGDSPD